MRFVLIFFYLLFFSWHHFIQAQNEGIPTIDKETEIKNNQIVKTALKRIRFSDNIGLFKISDSLIGAVNKKGSIIIPAEYLKIFEKDNIYVLERNNSTYHFYAFTTGLLSSVDSDTFNIQSGVILFSTNELWGAYIIKKKGADIIRPSYKRIEVAGNSLFLHDYNSWSVFNTNKEHCCINADTLSFRGEHLIYIRNGLEGILDDKGIELTNAIYNDIREELAAQIKFRLGNQGYMPYDTVNGFIVTHDASILDVIDSFQYAADTLKYFNYFKRADKNLLIVGKDSLVGVFDVVKKKFITPVAHTATIPEVDERIFLMYDTSKFSIIDFDGIVLSEPHTRFDTVYEFHEGRAKFLKEGNFGFIDRRGNVRIAPQYKVARDFHDGAAAVLLKGKWGFIDDDETILVQPLYDEVIDFQNDIAAVKKGKLWFFVKKDGRESSNIKYDSVRYSGNGYWYVYKDKKVGLVDVAGREKLGARYDDLNVCEEKVVVKKFNKYGIVDMQENTVMPIVYDYINCNNNVFVIMKKKGTEVREVKYGN